MTYHTHKFASCMSCSKTQCPSDLRPIQGFNRSFYFIIIFFNKKNSYWINVRERERERERELIWGWAGPKLGSFSSFFFFFLKNWIVTIRDDIFEP